MKLPKDVFSIRSINNLLIVGLSIWVFTNVVYTLLSWVIAPLGTESALITFCAIVVLLLSFIAIILLSDYQLEVSIKSYLKALSYTLALYFIANGVQSLYAAIQPPDTRIGEQRAELIPFLDSRPWLPPAGMRISLAGQTKANFNLTELNHQLSYSLDSATSRLESCGLMTDSIFLTVIPDSREVGKGGIFRSEVVLAARLDKSYVKSVSVNDNELQLKNGIAIFEEATSSQNRNVRNLDYKAEIQLYGENQTIEASDSYKIIRPYIEVSSQAVNSLFLNCGNELSMQVPILGSDYKPTFKVDGGSFRYGNRPGNITVLPSSRQVDIDVYNEKALIGRKTFPVRRVPSPSIQPFVNGKPIDPDQGVSKGISSITLSVHPDSEFQRLLPKDANYRVQECEISLVSSGIVRSKMKGKANSNISSLTRKAKAGDQLRIEINSVLRKNFKGDIEKVSNFYPKFFLISLK
ncbi:MAG: GldM family protein [Cyclobacteriaceae bacterium]